MVIRYNTIKDLLPQLNSKEIDELCLSSAETRRIGTLLDDMIDCNSVRKDLQSESVTLSDVRGLFDAIIERFSETKDNISEAAGITYSLLFESAIVKVQLGNIGSLSREQHISIGQFLV